MSKITAGIIGAAGYTAGELLRILINHPDVDIGYLQSDSMAGRSLASVHKDLFHLSDKKFTKDVQGNETDVVFLCKGHGESVKILESGMVNRNARVIDLSQDFRIKDASPEIQNIYGDFIYGLPELNKKDIRTAKCIANPGCFATCLQLGLLPLAYQHLLKDEIHISAITGSTGAGQNLTDTSHFSWRNNNMSVYKPFNHQHLSEVRQSIMQLYPGFDKEILFIPYRGNFTRGIIATIYIRTDLQEEKIRQIYDDYYADEPFVFVSEVNIDLKQIVNTNFCQLYLMKSGDHLLIISTIDNLLKGASGQAVQNMNLMFGLPESKGLYLKSTAF